MPPSCRISPPAPSQVRGRLRTGAAGSVERDRPVLLRNALATAAAAAPDVPLRAQPPLLPPPGVAPQAAARAGQRHGKLLLPPQPQSLWLWVSQDGLPPSPASVTGYPKSGVPKGLARLKEAAEAEARAAAAADEAARGAQPAGGAAGGGGAGGAPAASDPRRAKMCEKCGGAKGRCRDPGMPGHLREVEAHCETCTPRGKPGRPCSKRGSSAKGARHWPSRSAPDTGAPQPAANPFMVPQPLAAQPAVPTMDVSQLDAAFNPPPAPQVGLVDDDLFAGLGPPAAAEEAADDDEEADADDVELEEGETPVSPTLACPRSCVMEE